MPFGFEDDGVPEGFGEPNTPNGPTVRENVDAGVTVINLAEMRASLEADRARRRGGTVGDGV